MPYRAECGACSLRRVVPDAESALELHENHVAVHGRDHFVEFEWIPADAPGCGNEGG
jgi:hypothetical protein